MIPIQIISKGGLYEKCLCHSKECVLYFNVLLLWNDIQAISSFLLIN